MKNSNTERTLRKRGEMMPRGDGTGPPKGGGGGRGRMGGRQAAGSGGFCVCPKCGEKVAHNTAQPCNQNNCPKCGTRMIRE